LLRHRDLVMLRGRASRRFEAQSKLGQYVCLSKV